MNDEDVIREALEEYTISAQAQASALVALGSLVARQRVLEKQLSRAHEDEAIERERAEAALGAQPAQRSRREA